MADDKNLSKSDIQTLTTRDGVAAFFATLDYRTGSGQPQTAAAMGITAGSLARQIKHIERIAVHDDGAEPLDLYLVELTSVTVAATQGLARALRNRIGNYLLVLTDDYERLDFVLLQRSMPSSPASPMTSRQVSVRPRVLTVNCRNPSRSSYEFCAGLPTLRRIRTHSTTSSFPPTPSLIGPNPSSTTALYFPTTT